MAHWAEDLIKECGCAGPEWYHMGATDSDEDCQRLLIEHGDRDIQGHHTFRHVFARIDTALHQCARDAKRDMLADSPLVAEGMEEDVDQMQMYRSYLYMCAADVFAEQAYCIRHKRMCPIWDLSLEPVSDDLITIESSSDEECVGAPKASLTRPVKGFQGWVWFDASPPCVDMSALGKRRGLSGPNAPSFYELCAMIRAKRPHVVTKEITSQKTATMLHSEIGDIYDCYSVEVCPCMLGMPQRRPRMMSWAVDKERVKFHGSIDEMLELAAASIESTAKEFFVFEEERKDEKRGEC